MNAIPNTRNDRIRMATIALAIFVLANASRSIASEIDFYWNAVKALPDPLRWAEEPLRCTVICLAGLWLAHRLPFRRMPSELGLAKPAPMPLFVTFLACSPMLIVPAILGRLNPELEPVRDLLFGSLIWPMGEEILFRGYAFHQLHKRAGLGFWPAAILVGVVFGAIHLSQASVQQLPLSGEIGAIAIISLGGILFAWLYVRWDYNLWAPFGAHAFMNLWWSLFDLADSPLGGWLPNVLRTLSAVLLIVLTIKREWVEARLRRVLHRS